jgi:hypothetical protein
MWTLSMRYKRARVRFENYIKGRYQMNMKQSKAFNIVKLLLTKSNIEVLIAPKSGERYIHYEDIFVTIYDERIEIINHKYSYDIAFPKDVIEDLTKRFNRRTEMERLKMKREITKNINNSLTHLLDELGIDKK